MPELQAILRVNDNLPAFGALPRENGSFKTILKGFLI